MAPHYKAGSLAIALGVAAAALNAREMPALEDLARAVDEQYHTFDFASWRELLLAHGIDSLVTRLLHLVSALTHCCSVHC